jgi:hypothetical protein
MTASPRTLEPALADFDVRLAEFVESVRRAPDAALRHKPQGEDYALGGLVIHVTDVLHLYTSALDALRTQAGEPVVLPSHATSTDDAALIQSGFGGDTRGGHLTELHTAHAALINALHELGDQAFNRQVTVLFSGSSEPRPTSPAEVLGWVSDHYAEHAKQVAELVSDWASSTR